MHACMTAMSTLSMPAMGIIPWDIMSLVIASISHLSPGSLAAMVRRGRGRVEGMSARSLTGLLAAVGIAAAAVLVTAAPAAAHDQLIDTDPPASSTVDAVPEQIVLTFSADVLADEGAAVVEVTDASGARVDDGDPIVDGPTVTQPLTAVTEPNGDVEVVWKVVSSDGHPISGEFTVTVAGATPTPTPTPTETATTPPTTEPSPTPTAVAPPADEDSTFGQVWPWMAGGILLLAVAGAVTYLLVSRARRTARHERLEQHADTGGAGPAGD
jgi:methionine-rich copper-binding protein CopC